MKTGFVITAIRKDGVRHMAEPNQGEYYVYSSQEIAQSKIDQIKTVNSIETIEATMGKDLQVRETEIYESGDSKRTIFKELHYLDAVHFRPMQDNSNVRCLNGSAHLKETRDIRLVTCEKCLNKNTCKRYWANATKNRF